MARSAESGQGSVLEATTLVFPKASVWESLAATKRSTKAKMQSQSGIYGQAVKDAAEKDHVDRKALAIVLKLDGMEDDDLHVTMYHIIDGCKKLGILKRAMAQEEMFSPGEISPGDVAKSVKAAKGATKPNGKAKPDKDPKPAGGRTKRGSNVVQIGDAARQVAEAAGADK